jgi:uncharacterized membrane protein YhaH (DUF805 family)
MSFWLLSPEGRLGRLRAFLYGLGFAGALFLFILLALTSGSMTALVLVVPVCLAAAWISFMIGVKRLHDMDVSGWFVLVPTFAEAVGRGAEGMLHADGASVVGSFVSTGFGLYMLLWPGDRGTNRYGPPFDG